MTQRLEAYIVAEYEGKRMLMPLHPDVVIAVEYEYPRDRFDPYYDLRFHEPVRKITVTATFIGATIWENGANPEDYQPDQPALEAPKPVIEQ